MISLKLSRRVWNTYSVSAFTTDLTGDRASQGGVVLSQVRKSGRNWQTRKVQSNGCHQSIAPTQSVSKSEGERLFLQACQS